ncbi:MAG TPA: NmrA family NAD(P)-binding protein [Sphingobium sp.]|nr:NmrA family NAD(P)-binding protein [Sphingobium sp.]
MLVSVLGGSGDQGSAQVRQLLAAGHAVRLVSRTRPEGCALDWRGADIFDEPSLTAAFAGSDALFANTPVPHRLERPRMMGHIGRAAQAAGVRRLVWNTATWIPDRPGDPGTYGINTAAINILFRTGVPATVFGAVLFMDNLQTGFARRFIVEEGRFHYPHAPHMRANWISLDDVARIMIAALDRPDLEGAWMNIGGPQALGPQQVAEILSDVIGRPIRYDPATPEQFGRTLADALGSSATPEKRAAMAQDMRDFYIYNNDAPTRPFQVNVEAMLERLPMRLETMREWAARQDWSAWP